MAAGPITWSEIEAYHRLTFADLSLWDVRLIRRLDAAWLNRQGEKTAPKKGSEDGAIPVSNVSALKAQMRATAAAHRMAREAKVDRPGR
jgi:hypothetical protein